MGNQRNSHLDSHLGTFKEVGNNSKKDIVLLAKPCKMMKRENDNQRKLLNSNTEPKLPLLFSYYNLI